MGDPGDDDGERIRSARTVVLRTTVALIVIMFLGLLKLSKERVTEFDLCDSTVDLSYLDELDVEDRSLIDALEAAGDDELTFQTPCNQRKFTRVAGWRWPAIVTVTASLAVAGGALALSAPRWIRRTGAIDEQRRIVPLSGQPRGAQVRYRLMPLNAAVMTAVAVVTVGLGVLAVAAGGAPWWLMALAFAVAFPCAWAAGGATVWVGPDGLTARTYFRRKHWRWSEIDDVRSAPSTYGQGGIPSHRLVIELTSGRTFSNESLCSTALATPSRTDQLVEAIHAYRAGPPDA